MWMEYGCRCTVVKNCSLPREQIGKAAAATTTRRFGHGKDHSVALLHVQMIELGREHFDASKFSKFGTHRSTLSVLQEYILPRVFALQEYFQYSRCTCIVSQSITWSKRCSLTEINISENHVYQWVVYTEINISEIMCIVLQYYFCQDFSTFAWLKPN